MRLPKGRELVVAEPVYYASIILLGPMLTSWLVFFGEFAGVLLRKSVNVKSFSRAAGKTISFGTGGTVYAVLFRGTAFQYGWEGFFMHLLAFIAGAAACVAAEHILDILVRRRLRFSPFATAVSLFIMAPIGVLIAVLFEFQPLGMILLFLPLAMLYRAAWNYSDLLAETRGVVEVLATTVDERDRYTGPHSQRVMEYSGEIARELSLDEDEVEEVMMAARIHDLGKVCLSDMVLCKDGPLDEEEYAQMKMHSEVGWKLTRRLFRREAGLVHSHHERYDGSGYPSGLSGREIPIGARILSAADAFESMIHPRHYRSALPVEEAVRRLRDGAGRQFDPEVVEVFVRIIEKRMALFSEAP
jgi:HD-GYP domain-containing protein (c-di-GMP phosphodiesterase class II)